MTIELAAEYRTESQLAAEYRTAVRPRQPFQKYIFLHTQHSMPSSLHSIKQQKWAPQTRIRLPLHVRGPGLELGLGLGLGFRV